MKTKEATNTMDSGNIGDSSDINNVTTELTPPSSRQMQNLSTGDYSALQAHEVERRLAAILSTDVSGYSRLMGDDDEATLQTLEIYRSLQFKLICQHRGRVVNAPGDALLAEFLSVSDAANCAVAIQKLLAVRNDELPESRRMEFRMGVHLGDVLVKEGALYGEGVNIAARLEGLADARGICISRTVAEQVKRQLDCPIDYIGEYLVKNIAEPVEVYRIRIFPDDPYLPKSKHWSPAIYGALIGMTALLLSQALIFWFWQKPIINALLTASAGTVAQVSPMVNTEEFKSRIAQRPLPAVLEPGTVFQMCQDCPEMVVVQPGSAMIGSDVAEPGRRLEEGPQHSITINKAFAMGRFEVTFRQWDTCVEAGGCRHKPEDRGWGRGNYPVIYVSWQDTQEYLTWLSQLTGYSYSLPAEAVWEYSARAGTTGAYWWGDEIGQNLAICSGCGEGMEDKTVPIGLMPANPFGLFEVHGNVWEWTQDCWSGSYAGAPKVGLSDNLHVQFDGCKKRVLRGGSWGAKPKDLRSARRRGDSQTLRSGKRGFRVHMTLP